MGCFTEYFSHGKIWVTHCTASAGSEAELMCTSVTSRRYGLHSSNNCMNLAVLLALLQHTVVAARIPILQYMRIIG